MVLISLNVKTIDGKDSVVRVDDEMPLGHLRNAIEASTGDESCSLNAQGFVDGLAVHVVTKPPPAPPTPNIDNAASQRHQQSEEEMGNLQVITQTLIVGQLLLERTSLFGSPNIAMDAISGVLEEIRGVFQLETEASLRTNLPNESFAVNVVLRANREQTVDSPARERFEALKVEVKKLAWLVALIKAQFADRIDAFFSNQDEPSQQEAYQAIGDILLAMHSFDHFDENTIKGFVERDGDQELITLIQELDSWQTPDDEAHLQTLNQNTIVRHCLSMDLSRLLVILSMVDAKINEHLMSRFNRILSRQHNLQSFSYAARLMNCFSSAFFRIQHARSHIYHSISDMGVHADENGMNRLFPQLLHYERGTEPPRADITLTFIRSRGEPYRIPTPSGEHSTGTATRSSGQPNILPLFTIDPFMTCSSRRYRVFESDSRHNDFWNDPETIRLGIRPPSNSVTASANQQQNGGMLYHHNSGSDDTLVNRMVRHAQMNAQRERFRESVLRVGGNSSSTVGSQPNEQGETAFNNIDDFARFVRQIFHSVVRSMAQNNSSIMPFNSAQIRNAFTANSHVSGFTPIIPSVSSRESGELLMNIGAARGLVTVTIPSEGNQQQNVQQPPSTDSAPSAN
uniref:Ubiquitin-like domain-containing protein n=1 Tax=Globodera rostochiensis TaxID=31243 RepID=A0A914HGZ5_GLORO